MYRLRLHLKDTALSTSQMKERGIPLDMIPLGTIRDLVWHPDGTKLAAAHEDYVVRVWDLMTATPRIVHMLEHISAATSVIWSPDTRMILSADRRKDGIYIWDASTGHKVEELYEHSSWVTSLDFDQE